MELLIYCDPADGTFAFVCAGCYLELAPEGSAEPLALRRACLRLEGYAEAGGGCQWCGTRIATGTATGTGGTPRINGTAHARSERCAVASQ